MMSAIASDDIMSAKSASAGRREVNNPHMKEVIFKRNVVLKVMLHTIPKSPCNALPHIIILRRSYLWKLGLDAMGMDKTSQ